MVCGLVMTVFQAGAVGFLAERVSEIYQIGAFFVWQMNAPYLLSGALLIALALVIAWKVIEKRRTPSPQL